MKGDGDMIHFDFIETVRESEETVCETSDSTGIRSSCHNSLLDSDIYDTCLPDLNNYFSLLARIAGEGFF